MAGPGLRGELGPAGPGPGPVTGSSPPAKRFRVRVAGWPGPGGQAEAPRPPRLGSDPGHGGQSGSAVRQNHGLATRTSRPGHRPGPRPVTASVRSDGHGHRDGWPGSKQPRRGRKTTSVGPHHGHGTAGGPSFNLNLKLYRRTGSGCQWPGACQCVAYLWPLPRNRCTQGHMACRCSGSGYSCSCMQLPGRHGGLT